MSYATVLSGITLMHGAFILPTATYESGRTVFLGTVGDKSVDAIT